MSRVKSFHVKILLLDKQELIQEVTETTTGQDLLDNIFKYLNLIETAYFGLRYQDNENQTVSRHINKQNWSYLYIDMFSIGWIQRRKYVDKSVDRHPSLYIWVWNSMLPILVD